MDTKEAKEMLLPFDYKNIDTTMAKSIDDEMLLQTIQGLNLIGVPGYGLVAELCKRFEKLIGE